jgi:hypothetical protein
MPILDLIFWDQGARLACLQRPHGFLGHHRLTLRDAMLE